MSSTPAAGGEVDIVGNNFGPAGTAATVLIAGKTCNSPVVQGHTLISCTIDPGTGANLQVALTVGYNTVWGSFSYASTTSSSNFHLLL